jgi:hypothetical protein
MLTACACARLLRRRPQSRRTPQASMCDNLLSTILLALRTSNTPVAIRDGSRARHTQQLSMRQGDARARVRAVLRRRHGAVGRHPPGRRPDGSGRSGAGEIGRRAALGARESAAGGVQLCTAPPARWQVAQESNVALRSPECGAQKSAAQDFTSLGAHCQDPKKTCGAGLLGATRSPAPVARGVNVYYCPQRAHHWDLCGRTTHAQG